jgi:hypothetical protein
VVHPRADRHAAALEEGDLQNEIQLLSQFFLENDIPIFF